MTRKVHLTGTTTRFFDIQDHITADDGDRVSFDVAQTRENLALAMMGGPIQCTNVRPINNEPNVSEDLE